MVSGSYITTISKFQPEETDAIPQSYRRRPNLTAATQCTGKRRARRRYSDELEREKKRDEYISEKTRKIEYGNGGSESHVVRIPPGDTLSSGPT